MGSRRILSEVCAHRRIWHVYKRSHAHNAYTGRFSLHPLLCTPRRYSPCCPCSCLGATSSPACDSWEIQHVERNRTPLEYCMGFYKKIQQYEHSIPQAEAFFDIRARFSMGPSEKTTVRRPQQSHIPDITTATAPPKCYCSTKLNGNRNMVDHYIEVYWFSYAML